MTIDLEKDSVLLNMLDHRLLLRRKTKPRTKLRLIKRPLNSPVLLKLPPRMMLLEQDKKPRLLPLAPNSNLLLTEPPELTQSMDLSITLMVLSNSQQVD